MSFEIYMPSYTDDWVDSNPTACSARADRSSRLAHGASPPLLYGRDTLGRRCRGPKYRHRHPTYRISPKVNRLRITARCPVPTKWLTAGSGRCRPPPLPAILLVGQAESSRSDDEA